MNETLYALLIGTAAMSIVLLAVFDFIPATVAQMVPLAVVPLVSPRRRKACAGRAC